MYWKDEGYLLSKNNFNENSIIIEAFTLEHGKCSGIVYGGTSRKNKKNFQIGNKILINCKSKSENKIGYFTIELIKPISPIFFDDKKRCISILAAASILKILLPERQLNVKIYNSFENLLNKLDLDNWIRSYILWEFSLIKDLGFEIDFDKEKKSINFDNYIVEINNRTLKIPKLLLVNNNINISKSEIMEALTFSKKLLLEYFIFPNRIKFPLSALIFSRFLSLNASTSSLFCSAGTSPILNLLLNTVSF